MKFFFKLSFFVSFIFKNFEYRFAAAHSMYVNKAALTYAAKDPKGLILFQKLSNPLKSGIGI